jgi:hypothetical protein
MPRVTWPLLNERPGVRLMLTPAGGQPTPFDLLADTGAGSNSSDYELILLESDCWSCGAPAGFLVKMSGAFAGSYLLFRVIVQIPTLGFVADVPAVGVPALPEGLEGFSGTACFRFLNRFDYGNFGNPAQFGLER